MVWLTEGGLSPHDVGFQLNDVPMSALGKPRGYGRPAEAFKGLMGDDQGRYGRKDVR